MITKNKIILVMSIVIAVLIFFLAKGCGKGEVVMNNTDTIVVTKVEKVPVHDTFYSKPKLTTTKPANPRDTQWIYLQPSNNCDTLKSQYNELLALHTSENVYIDGYELPDSLGFITTYDTIIANSIHGRKWVAELYKKSVTTTTTITNTVEQKRNQLYLGFGLAGRKGEFLTQAQLSVLFKTKKDNLFGVYTSADLINPNLSYGIKYYKLISFRKKK
jgi:hypothetical protein